MPTLPPHFHVGIVVPDVLAAREHLTELLGVSWGPVVHLDEVEYRDVDGNDLMLPTTISYTTGEPALEVIQEQPGTVWERNEHSNLHHLGVWTDDLVGDSGTFGAGACPLQLAGRAGDDSPISFAYHRDEALGVRFELVDAGWRDAMAFLWQPDAGEG